MPGPLFGGSHRLWGSCPPSRSSCPCTVCGLQSPFLAGSRAACPTCRPVKLTLACGCCVYSFKCLLLSPAPCPSVLTGTSLTAAARGKRGVRAPLSPFQRWSGRAQRGGRCCPGSQGPAQLQGCWGPSSAPGKQGLFQKEAAVEINPNLQSVRPTFSPPPSDKGETKTKSRFWINRIFPFKWFLLCVCCADDFSCRVRRGAGVGRDT